MIAVQGCHYFFSGLFFLYISYHRHSTDRREKDVSDTEEDFGLLVQVSFDITVFTLPAYQRGGLPRPSLKSHLEDGFALRCFQRLS